MKTYLQALYSVLECFLDYLFIKIILVEELLIYIIIFRFRKIALNKNS